MEAKKKEKLELELGKLTVKLQSSVQARMDLEKQEQPLRQRANEIYNLLKE